MTRSHPGIYEALFFDKARAGGQVLGKRGSGRNQRKSKAVGCSFMRIFEGE